MVHVAVASFEENNFHNFLSNTKSLNKTDDKHFCSHNPTTLVRLLLTQKYIFGFGMYQNMEFECECVFVQMYS
jgi:hypothetical protein